MQKQKTEDKLIMDGNKLMWHPERLAAFLRGDRIAPLHIDMGLTTGCNMDCTYCYGVIQGRTSVAKRFDLNKDVINRFLIDAKELGVRSIAFIGEGENTLNPALYDALETARQIKLDVSLATNGILLPEERMPLMLSSLSWIRFNISAANPAVFEQIHRVKQYEKVLSNIRALVQAKKDLSSRTVIGLQMVVMDENVDQIVPLAKLGQELGVDYFVVKSCSDTYQKFLESPIEKYGEISHILQEAESYSTETYSVIVKWNKITNKGLKDYKTCYGTQFILQMSGDGSVFPCGHWFNVRREEFIMGNIINQSFREIVESNRYWDVQQKIQTVNVNKDCESNCRQHYCNQTLWKLKNPPEHVNFI